MSWHAYYASVIRIIKGTPAQETMPSGGHRWGVFRVSKGVFDE